LSILVPEIVWLSTLGASEFNFKNSGIFTDVSTYLFPRTGSLSQWKMDASTVQSNYVKVSDQFEPLYSHGNALDLRKGTPHMMQALAHIKSLIKERQEDLKKSYV